MEVVSLLRYLPKTFREIQGERSQHTGDRYLQWWKHWDVEGLFRGRVPRVQVDIQRGL